MQPQGLKEDERGLEYVAKVIDEVLRVSKTAAINTLLEEMYNLMVRKGQDYSGTGHQWTSFELQGELTQKPPEEVFISLMALKFARLVSLVRAGHVPNFESMRDSWLDFANYAVLFTAYIDWKNRHGNTIPTDTADTTSE
jgi:hypothetical protein